ncbi:MAG: hypothetical protein AB1540_07640 [Bdellovibrionota bacterium]
MTTWTRISKLSKQVSACPQCGEDWSVLQKTYSQDCEFCPRCGSPVSDCSIDPFRTRNPFTKASATQVNRRAKFVVRAGVFGLGTVGLVTGSVLCYGGWVDPGEMDLVQVWISRVGGPFLLLQGLVYVWLPFRQPVAAQVIPLQSRRRAG